MIRLRRIAGRVAALLFVLLAALPAARAHEARPCYLEITETEPGRFSVLWRTPVLAGVRLPVALKLPEGLRNVEEPSVQELSDSLLERRSVDAGPAGLAGKRIAFPGLQLTITDVLVRIERLDGTHTTELVRPPRPWFEVAAPRGAAATAVTFLAQGIEHILLGVDHLLFVLGLLLIVRTPWMLVKTVTAFTVAHSLTLAVATFRIADIPALPLNALIALSILFLGPEIVRVWRGQTSFTIRHPWVVAFAFGLLHGFGFATAMTGAGLPRQDLPLALLSFNIGVELGQLAFVGAVLAVAAFARKVGVPAAARRLAVRLAPYAVGSLAAFWFVERTTAFF